jgi:hypothetical protein
MPRAAEDMMPSMYPRDPDADAHDGWERLIAATVANTVRLAGAGCRHVERAAIFDAGTRSDCVEALKACRDCPVIGACNAWAHSSMRLSGQNGYSGVIGGNVYGAARQWLRPRPVRR